MQPLLETRRVPTSCRPSRSRLRLLPALALLSTLLAATTVEAAQEIATRDLDPDAEYPILGHAAALPGGGFAVAWNRGFLYSFGVDQVFPGRPFAAWLSKDGQPVSPVLGLEAAGENLVGPSGLASSAAGEALVILAPRTREASGALGRRISRDTGLGPLHPIDQCSGQARVDLEPAGEGYWLACIDRVLPVARSGDAAGPAIVLADPQASAEPVRISATPDRGFWASWNQVFETGRRVVARRYDSAGMPVTSLIVVSAPGVEQRGESPDVGSLPGGGALVTWSAEGTVLVRRVGPAGELPHPPRPAAEVAGALDQSPRIAVSGGGLAVVGWTRDLPYPEDGLGILRAVDPSGAPLGEEHALDRGSHPEPVFGQGADLLVLAHEVLPAGDFGTYARPRIGFVPAPGLVPPPGPGLLSAEFPGFRFWVRIGGDEAAPRIGSPEPLCLPETVCVSGALPGRTEVLLRIVGPRPNGYLWPIVVRFTPSAVELWIEQVASGVSRYYRLEGSSPGSEDLDGFFDRTGFLPQ